MSKTPAQIKREYYERNREACLRRSHEQRLKNKIGKPVKIYEYLSNTEKSFKRATVNPKGHLLSRARSRAKLRGCDFDLCLEDIIIPTHCPYLGYELVFNKGSAKKDSYAVDRINNELGYVKGNVEVISHLANNMKRDSTVEEQIRFAKEVLRRNGIFKI